MNKKRREMIRNAITHLSSAINIVETVSDEEDESLSNMPENLQYTDRYEEYEDSLDLINDSIELMEKASDQLNSSIS